jgi:hypothetical protein
MRPNLFHVLIEQRGWSSFAAFNVHFTKTARALARVSGSPLPATKVSITRRTFERWINDDVRLPHPDVWPVLEELLGYPVKELFDPVPEALAPQRHPQAEGFLGSARAIERRWPTSHLSVALMGRGTDVWELDGARAFDGTSVAVTFQEVGGRAVNNSVELPRTDSLHTFTRSSRRGLIVGADFQRDNPQLFLLDSTVARGRLASGRAALTLPTAHELDDLTYALVWAVLNFDDALLADGESLEAEEHTLDAYLNMPKSAVSKAGWPGLTTIGSTFLGSHFCARHIMHRLDDVSDAPAFWSREQSGEEAAAWLFFRHKHAYLAQIARRFAGPDRLTRAFCIPEEAVKGSETYERVPLFLALALMELSGITVRVCTEPDYGDVDGFVMIPGQRAITANWGRSEAVWNVDTTDQRATVAEYADAFAHANAHTILSGEDPGLRLRALAGYLELDWSWLLVRCRELGALGLAGMIRPRSRLLTTDQVDAALCFVGALG